MEDLEKLKKELFITPNNISGEIEVIKKPKNAKRSALSEQKLVYKEQDFEAYILWRSLPSMLRGKSEEELIKLGYDDVLLIELFQIKNQTDFAKKFGIKDLGTLTDWNKKIAENNLLFKIIKSWAKRLTANVMAALFREILKNGDAARIKLWLQFVEDWSEKTRIEQNLSPELQSIVNKMNAIIKS